MSLCWLGFSHHVYTTSGTQREQQIRGLRESVLGVFQSPDAGGQGGGGGKVGAHGGGLVHTEESGFLSPWSGNRRGGGGRGAWSVWDSCDPSPFTPPASGLRRSFGQGWGGVFLSEPRAAGVKLGQGSWELGPVPGGWQCVSLRSWE